MTRTPRTALVTGAASGIGAAIARRLVALDWRVVGLDVADATADGIEQVRADITDESAVAAALTALPSLDAVVNAAGIATETRVDDGDLDVVRRTIEVNLLGALHVTRAALPLLRESPAPRVLHVGSIQGFRAGEASLGYAASKGALHNATRSMAIDLAADGILVNALAPGFIDTPMAVLGDGRTEYETDWFRSVYVDHGRIPLRRPGTADEVAAAAVFFVSAENTYVTGSILAVDGGLTAGF